MLTTYENIADVVAVVMVCITLLTVISGKIEERLATGRISVPWLINEVGASLIAGYIAWEVYPHLPTPDFVTRTVFVMLAVHGGARVIVFFRDKVFPPKM